MNHLSKHLLGLFLFIGIFDANAAGPFRFRVDFTDKNNTPYSLANPSAYLSQKAIIRRIKQQISIDSLDLPVNKLYTDALSSLGAKILYTSKWMNSATIQLNDSSAINTIKQLPMVKSVTLTFITDLSKSKKIHYNKFGETRNQVLNYGYSYNQIAMHNTQILHEKGYTGKGMTIALLDAGFYKANSYNSLDSLFKRGQIMGTHSFVEGVTDVYTQHYHGMSVLSIIGGNLPGEMMGVAPDADFWLIQTEDADTEFPVEMDNWVAGAEFADSVGVDIINSSLGYSEFDDSRMNLSYEQIDGHTTTATRAANIAVEKGILVVVSAGNEGDKTWHYISAPSDAENALCIGAVAADSTIAAFSSRGFDNRNIKPDLVSQGQGTVVTSSAGFSVYGNGTSFSAPVISGVAACLWQALPNQTAKSLREIMIKTADRNSNPDRTYGNGITNAALALLSYGQSNFVENAAIVIMPNPNNGSFLMSLNNTGSVEIFAYDMQGRKMKIEVQFRQGIAECHIPDVAKGICLLKVVQNNKTISQHKIIIAR